MEREHPNLLLQVLSVARTLPLTCEHAKTLLVPDAYRGLPPASPKADETRIEVG